VRLTVRLPREDGQVELYAVGEPGPFVRPPGPLRAREALAAAHVVADPATDPSVVEWDATLEQRR
jgi:Protein of unknown function (DUF993)